MGYGIWDRPMSRSGPVIADEDDDELDLVGSTRNQCWGLLRFKRNPVTAVLTQFYSFANSGNNISYSRERDRPESTVWIPLARFLN